MADEIINRHYATLLGLGTEWKVTEVDLNVLGKKLEIYLEYATDGAICPACGKLGSVYNQQPERVWRHLDTMQFETLIHAKTPRVRCADHKVKVIELPWASRSSHFTLLFEAFAIDIPKAARSIQDARELLRPSWRSTGFCRARTWSSTSITSRRISTRASTRHARTRTGPSPKRTTGVSLTAKAFG